MRELTSDEEEYIKKKIESDSELKIRDLSVLSWRQPTEVEKEIINKKKSSIYQTTEFAYGGIWMKFGVALIIIILISMIKIFVTPIFDGEKLNAIYIFVLCFLFLLSWLVSFLFFNTFIQREGDKFRKELKGDRFDIIGVTSIGYAKHIVYTQDNRSTYYIAYLMHNDKYIVTKDVAGSLATEDNVFLLRFKINLIKINLICSKIKEKYCYVAVTY